MAQPRLSGRTLAATLLLARTKPGAMLLKQLFLKDLRVHELAALPLELLGDVPLDTRARGARPPRRTDGGLPLPNSPPGHPTCESIVARYVSGATTPDAIVKKAYDAIARLESGTPYLGPMCDRTEARALEAATASTLRYRSKKPLGPLDGVPIVIKEEIGVQGVPRRAGSDFESNAPWPEDSTLVARLASAGAIVLGTTVMTEYGMTPLGFNPKRRMPRNPHGYDRLAGGSSTGTAVAVATGLVPMGIGSDGGGSIRIPASLNGVFGIKPTWGRVSRDGDLAGGSVAHVGPIASNTQGLALALEATAGADERDRQTFGSPDVRVGEFTSACTRSVKGLRIGVDKSLWHGASRDVERACEDALLALEREGAVRVSISTQVAPFAAPIGYLSIGPEALAACRKFFVTAREQFTPDLELSFSVLNELGLNDYMFAARLRDGLRLEMVRLFADIDVLALPATLSTAPKATDAEMAGGLVDSAALDALCKPNFLGNLTGLPALSAPVGLDSDGLPIGLQLIGDAWDEATLLSLSAELERLGVARAPKPKASVHQ